MNDRMRHVSTIAIESEHLRLRVKALGIRNVSRHCRGVSKSRIGQFVQGETMSLAVFNRIAKAVTKIDRGEGDGEK